MNFTDTAAWHILGIFLFLSVFVVIGLNATVFREYEEVEEEKDIQDLC